MRVGSKEARLRTFLVGATSEAGKVRLALGPVPNCPVVPVRAVLDFSHGGREFWVAGPVAPSGDRGAEMTVESGVSERPSRSTRLAPAADVAFAVCLLEVEGGGRGCFPILDIGVRGLRVETSTPLSVGTVLADLIVVLRREVLRRGEGVITSCSPARYPDGRLVYECGVRYRSAGRRPVEPAGEDQVEVDDIGRVRAILWGLCDLEYQVSVSGPTGVVSGRMLPQRGTDRGRVPELHCRVNDADRLPVRSGAVIVECSLFGSGYRFYARVTDRLGDVLTLSPSPKLREWHPPRRGTDAAARAERAARVVSYRHALTGARRAPIRWSTLSLRQRRSSFPPGASDEEPAQASLKACPYPPRRGWPSRRPASPSARSHPAA